MQDQWTRKMEREMENEFCRGGAGKRERAWWISSGLHKLLATKIQGADIHSSFRNTQLYRHDSAKASLTYIHIYIYT